MESPRSSSGLGDISTVTGKHNAGVPWSGIGILFLIVLVFILLYVALLLLAALGVSALAGFSPPGIAMTISEAILGGATCALAYAAYRQSVASVGLLGSAEGQATATERLAAAAESQADAMKAQLDLIREQVKVTREQAEVSRLQTEATTAQVRMQESIRRASTFPEVKIVTQQTPPGLQSEFVVPGGRYFQLSTPQIGIANVGGGPARKVRLTASWKLLEIGRVGAATVGELLELPWTPTPETIPLVERIEARDGKMANLLAWMSDLVKDGVRLVIPVAVYVKVRWIDPDGNEAPGVSGGLSMVPGSERQNASGMTVREFIGLGMEDAPSPDQFSDEARIVV